MKQVKHSFATFPEFSKLTLADRAAYEKLIEDYPPYADFSYPYMLTWWNTLNSCRISLLNGNLILSYWIPGDEINSGLSLVGDNKVDETLCTIFDYLKARNEKPRLVHVPEFVLENVRYPDLYICKSERSSDECIMSTTKYASLENVNAFFRRKVNRFLVDVDNNDIVVKELDLTLRANKQLLIACYQRWEKDSPKTHSLNQAAVDTLYNYVNNSEKLGVECVAFFLEGSVVAYLLYNLPSDPKYVTVAFGIFDHKLQSCFEVACHMFAKWFSAQGVVFANIDVDNGNMAYRTLQIALGPSHFLRKYTIRPMSKCS